MPVSFWNVTFLLSDINDVSSATWSVTWTDINADGRPDLYVNNHADKPPMLFLSWGDRYFGRGQALDLEKDGHAAVWADYDGDGFPELLERVGGGAGKGLSWRKDSTTSSSSKAAGWSSRTTISDSPTPWPADAAPRPSTSTGTGGLTCSWAPASVRTAGPRRR